VRRLRKSSGRRSPRPPWGGPSPAYQEDGRSKKVEGSPRARRGGKRPVALAGFPLRRQTVGIRGRERVSHFHDALEGASTQGTEGLRKGAPQPRQESVAHRLDHSRRRHGRVGGHRGGDRRRDLRGLRRALLGADPPRGAGGGTRRARGAQDREGQGRSGISSKPRAPSLYSCRPTRRT